MGSFTWVGLRSCLFRMIQMFHGPVSYKVRVHGDCYKVLV